MEEITKQEVAEFIDSIWKRDIGVWCMFNGGTPTKIAGDMILMLAKSMWQDDFGNPIIVNITEVPDQLAEAMPFEEWDATEKFIKIPHAGKDEDNKDLWIQYKYYGGII